MNWWRSMLAPPISKKSQSTLQKRSLFQIRAELSATSFQYFGILDMDMMLVLFQHGRILVENILVWIFACLNICLFGRFHLTYYLTPVWVESSVQVSLVLALGLLHGLECLLVRSFNHIVFIQLVTCYFLLFENQLVHWAAPPVSHIQFGGIQLSCGFISSCLKICLCSYFRLTYIQFGGHPAQLWLVGLEAWLTRILFLPVCTFEMFEMFEMFAHLKCLHSTMYLHGFPLVNSSWLL